MPVRFDRRAFLMGSTVAAIAAPAFAGEAQAGPKLIASGDAPVTGHAKLAEFDGWTVYEDQSKRDGAITFVKGGQAVVLPKRLEACFDNIEPKYLGLSLKDICLADADLLADRLLAGGDDPDPEAVRRAAPPAGWNYTQEGLYTRLAWTNFVGTRQQGDTMPVFPNGRTRGDRPEHAFPELQGDDMAKKRWEGLLGGWLPAMVYPARSEQTSPSINSITIMSLGVCVSVAMLRVVVMSIIWFSAGSTTIVAWGGASARAAIVPVQISC